MNLLNIPFTYHWIMKKAIGSPKTLLDLGCGNGDFSYDLFKNDKFQITGVELYPESIKQAKSKNIYSKVVKGDIVKLPIGLKKHYDVVLVSQAIEHLTKKKGHKAIQEWEKRAKRVVISTPVGFVPFHQLELSEQDQNPYQKHLSGWEVEDFEKMGYKVYGQGWGFLYRNSFIKQLPSIFFPIINIISFITSPVMYFSPRLAMYQIAVKEIL